MLRSAPKALAVLSWSIWRAVWSQVNRCEGFFDLCARGAARSLFPPEPILRPEASMKPRICAIVLTALLATVAIQADTLVLTNGRRIQGHLVGVTDGQI